MSQPTASGANEVLFCQRNNRLWVTSLVGSAVLVLVLAFWLWRQHGSLGGVQNAAHVGSSGAPPASPAAFHPVPPAPSPGMSQGSRQLGVQVAAPSGTASHLQQSFNQVAEMIRPTVVNISAVRSGTPANVVANPNGARFIDPFDGIPEKMIGNIAFESVGSGVIIDPAGYIVTNDHLVGNATAIAVTRFNEAEALPARIVMTDPGRDLALLKIDGNGPFPAASLGNSDAVGVGNWVLAVGNPFGLGHTVTAGIVSSRRSSLVIGGVTYTDLLQTDAPINQGSSGGPLVDLRGNVIGINTAIYAPTGVFNGTGFAIPSNQVGSFVSRAINGNGAAPVAQAGPTAPAGPSAARAWLGIHGSTVTAQMAPKLGLQRPEGVFVNVVDKNSPASDAEIRPGDVITNVAGQPVLDQQGLEGILAALPPGLRVPVTVQQRGRTKTRRVKLGLKAPGRPVAARRGW